MVIKRIKKLEGIDPKSWEHPADKAALGALKQMKGFDDLVRLLVSVTTERSLKLMALASCIKVSPNQYPKLHTALENVVEIFDWDYCPDLYVSQNPFWNAGVIGVKEPFIIINTSMVKGCTDEEITAVIAHEMGHIMSGHALYKTLLWMLTKLSLNLIPMAGILILAIKAALLEWDRKSELTADRAGLLAVQDDTSSYNLLMKLAGAESLAEVNLNEIFAQAREYENQKSVLDNAHKFLNQLWESHPFPVIRLQELKSWEMSGYYQAILNGSYSRKNNSENDVKEDIKSGFEYYKDSFNKKDDPLSDIINDVGEGIGKAAGDIGKKINDFFNN